MKRMMLGALLCVAVAACKGTGKEGEAVVEKPVIGVQEDTVHYPTVDVKKDTATVAVPKVEVKKDSAKVVVPKVEVKKP